MKKQTPVPNKARIEVVEPQPKRLLPGMIVFHPDGGMLASVLESKNDGYALTAWRYTRASREIWPLARGNLVVVKVVLDGYEPTRQGLKRRPEKQ